MSTVLEWSPAVDPADDVEAHVAPARHEQPHCVEQQIDALLRNDLTDVNQTPAIARVHGATILTNDPSLYPAHGVRCRQLPAR